MTTFEQRLKDTLSHAYDIDRELGGGGMSRVFVATDRSLGRKVVIKLLSPELTADVNRGRFRREIQVAAQLQHPHIVTLLSAGEHEDLVYYTMPFIPGESLKSAVEKNGPMPVEDVVRVMYHVSEALDYAHGEGVVHRDIKPANILRSGSYYLVTDFGVAKALNASMPASGMTSTGMAVGTPAYMSPEQLAGDAEADHRIDIYAVGLLAYELLKGKSPFAAATAQRVLAAVLTLDPPRLIEVRPDVPGRLSEIVMSCLAKDPADRPVSARALLVELDTFSTASGEIRTTEYKVPRVKKSTPGAGVSAAAIPGETISSGETASSGVTAASGVTGSSGMIPSSGMTTPTAESAPVGESPSGQIPTYAPSRPQRSWNKIVMGAVALLIPAVAVAFLLSQRSDGTAPPAADTTAVIAAVADSGLVVPPPPPATAAESVAAAVVPARATVDSLKKIADSVRRAARAEAAKKAIAQAESVRRLQETPRAMARRAASAMLSNASARASFNRGATRMGGPLGTRRRGDLQTQIDAIAPFLTSAGLTYEQFKSLVAESGVTLFDEFGRMVPDSLARFAGGTN